MLRLTVAVPLRSLEPAQVTGLVEAVIAEVNPARYNAVAARLLCQGNLQFLGVAAVLQPPIPA